MKDLYKIKTFIDELKANGYAEWHDGFGDYCVQIGDNILQEYYEKEDCRFIVSDFLSLKFNKFQDFSQIVSIGGFQVHNQGKKEAQDKEMDLTTIPIPLSNDSFGTNRYSLTDSEQSPSIRSVYPRQTIIDLQELSKFGTCDSYNGFGEFIGLYYSVIDYSQKDEISPDEECLEFIVENIDYFINTFQSGNELETLRCISIILIIKCLIMRINEDHRIGCGIDHSIARIFEREQKYSHGKAVYMACLIVSLLFKEWEKWGVSFSLLRDIGQSLGFVGDKEISLLHHMKIEKLIQKAIAIRKDRKTSLQKLSEIQINTTQHQLNHLKWDISY